MNDVMNSFIDHSHTLTDAPRSLSFSDFRQSVDKIYFLIKQNLELVNYDATFRHPLLCEIAQQLCYSLPDDEKIAVMMFYAVEKLGPYIGGNYDGYGKLWNLRFSKFFFVDSYKFKKEDYLAVKFPSKIDAEKYGDINNLPFDMNVSEWVSTFKSNN